MFRSAAALLRERVRRMDAVRVEPRVRVELTFSEMVGGVLRDPVLRSVQPRSPHAARRIGIRDTRCRGAARQ
jgi:hypothetical protein